MVQKYSLTRRASLPGIANYETVNDLPLIGVTPGRLAWVANIDKLYIFTTAWQTIDTTDLAPVITVEGLDTYILAIDGTPTIVTLDAEDPEGLPITWTYEVTSGALGDTATVSQDNNVFTITPSTELANEGVFEITFTVSDGTNSATTVSSFILYFPPTWTTIGPQGIRLGESEYILDPRNDILANFDLLGRDAIAISKNYTAATAPNGEVGSGTANDGSVFMLSKSNTNTWTYRQTIEIPNGNISVWGRSLAFGNTDENFLYIYAGNLSSFRGVYCYRTQDNGVTWSQVSNGNIINSGLGGGEGLRNDIVLSDDDLTLFIGDPQFNDGRGRVLVYSRSSADPSVSSWTLQQTLTPTVSLPRQVIFGSSISLHENDLIIGCPGEFRTTSGRGSSYIFSKSENTWEQVIKLTGNTNSLQEGISVAIANNLAVSGGVSFGFTTGAVRIYRFSGTAWNFVTQISGTTNSEFGSSVELTYDVQRDIYHLFVGAPGIDRTYIYQSVNGGTSWTIDQNFAGPAGRFGSQVAVYDRLLLVSAPTASFTSSGTEIGVLRWFYSTD